MKKTANIVSNDEILPLVQTDEQLDAINNMVQSFQQELEGAVDSDMLYTALGLDVTNKARFFKRNLIGTAKKPTGFIAGVDYEILSSGKSAKYALTTDTAKHLIMMSKTEFGFKLRSYFISIERQSRAALEGARTQLLREVDNLSAEHATLLNDVKELKSASRLFDSEFGIPLKEMYYSLNKKIGRNKMYRELRRMGILTFKNKPTSLAVRNGYIGNTKDGIVITGKAIPFIYQELNEYEDVDSSLVSVEQVRGLLRGYTQYIDFDFETHTYKVNGVKMPSVSTVIKQFIEPFESEMIARRCVNKYNREAKEGKVDWNCTSILKYWDFKRDIAAEYGTLVHAKVEQYVCELIGKEFDTTELDSVDLKAVCTGYGFSEAKASKIEAKFVEEALQTYFHLVDWIGNALEEGYEIVDTEVRLVDMLKKYTGTFDLLLYKDNGLYIVDYKTNRKDSLTEQKSYTTLKAPFEHLYDTPFNKYSLQQNSYRQLIELSQPVRVKGMMLLHAKKDGVTELEVPFFDVPF